MSSRATLCIASRPRNAERQTEDFGLRFMTPRAITRILFYFAPSVDFCAPQENTYAHGAARAEHTGTRLCQGARLVYAGLASAQHPRTRALTTTKTASSCRRRNGKGTKGHGGDTREVGGPKGERMRARGGSRKSELLRGVTSYFGKQLLRVDTREPTLLHHTNATPRPLRPSRHLAPARRLYWRNECSHWLTADA